MELLPHTCCHRICFCLAGPATELVGLLFCVRSVSWSVAHADTLIPLFGYCHLPLLGRACPSVRIYLLTRICAGSAFCVNSANSPLLGRAASALAGLFLLWDYLVLVSSSRGSLDPPLWVLPLPLLGRAFPSSRIFQLTRPSVLGNRAASALAGLHFVWGFS